MDGTDYVTYYATIKMPNNPAKGKIEITKTGEAVAGWKIGDIWNAVWDKIKLGSTKFEIYSAEDIVHSDGVIPVEVYNAADDSKIELEMTKRDHADVDDAKEIWEKILDGASIKQVKDKGLIKDFGKANATVTDYKTSSTGGATYKNEYVVTDKENKMSYKYTVEYRLNYSKGGFNYTDVHVTKNSVSDEYVAKIEAEDSKPIIKIDGNDEPLPLITMNYENGNMVRMNKVGDGKPDVNVDTDGDGKPDVNVDTDGDGKPDVNVDTDGDGKPDIDIDTDGDGKPDTNLDTDNDGKPDVNVDTDGDGKPDANVDTDGDGIPDINIDTDGDGKPDKNIEDLSSVYQKLISIKLKGTPSKNSLKVTWSKIPGADGYDVFAAYCGRELSGKYTKFHKIATVNNRHTAYTIKKLNGKKLRNDWSYKAYVRAFVMKDGKKHYVRKSLSIHVSGIKYKYTNAKKVTVNKKAVTLKKGKSTRVYGKVYRLTTKRNLLPNYHGPNLKYFTTNKGVAKISKNGTITATGKGTCKVYVMALNGVKAPVKVTVK